MSRRTIAKKERALGVMKTTTHKDGTVWPVFRIRAYKPAANPIIKTVEYKGVKMEVLAAEGQIISPKREYKRRLANDSKERKAA